MQSVHCITILETRNPRIKFWRIQCRMGFKSHILLYDKVKILHYGHKTQMVKKSLYSKKEQTLYFYFTNAHTITCSKWCWLFFINFILFIQMALVIYNKYYVIYYKYPTPPGLNNYMCIHEINVTNIAFFFYCTLTLWSFYIIVQPTLLITLSLVSSN